MLITSNKRALTIAEIRFLKTQRIVTRAKEKEGNVIGTRIKKTKESSKNILKPEEEVLTAMVSTSSLAVFKTIVLKIKLDRSRIIC